MRVLVTGASGLLGRYIVQSGEGSTEIHGLGRGGRPQGLPANAHYRSVDISDHVDLGDALTAVDPEVIIHAAAEGGVDLVQGRCHEYRSLNVGVSETLATYCAVRNIRYVYVSSNAVFDGRGSKFADDSPHSPVNDYGRLKSEAERKVVLANECTLIIRPILMYGWPYHGRRLNPVVSWISELRAGRQISVVNDVWTEPLAAWDCARAIWAGVTAGAVGPINVSGGTRMSLYELALQVSEVFGLSGESIRAIRTSFLEGLAPRPVDTSFDLKRLTQELGVIPSSPREGLAILRDSEVAAKAEDA